MATLTVLQAAFVRAYVANPLDGSAAYIAAGGSKRRAKQGASEMLKVPAVAEAVKKGIQKLDAKAERDGLAVRKDIEKATRMAFKAKSLGHIFKGLELEGKVHKIFTENHEHSGPNGMPLVPPTINVNFIKPEGNNG